MCQTGKWGYGADDGPHTWHESYPDARGCSQSPINIDLDNAKFDMTLNIHPLRVCMGRERVTSQTLLYTGHNFRIDYEGTACVSGGPVPHGQLCHVCQISFHYGSNPSSGSEHLMNCFQFPCECQIMCYNASRYRCYDDAKKEKDGLLILSIMFHMGNKNKAIERIMGPLTSIHYFKTHDFRQESQLIDLQHLLPDRNDDCRIDKISSTDCINRYYTYPGSLTIPPCYESVTWIIFEGSVSLSEDQLHHFQKVHMGDSCCGPDNFRPVCPLGERIVCKNFV